jgi:hypothetical protein
MNWLDSFNIVLHTSETTENINTTNILTSLELTKQLNSAASAYDAAPFSNSLLFSIDYSPSSFIITKGQKVELYFGEVKLGVFYVTDFTPPADDEAIATITAYDLFYNLINKEIIPEFEILDGVDIREYIKQVFLSVGIAEEKILISEDLAANTLNYSVCAGKSLADILIEYCLASDTYIFVDEEENIRVIPKEVIVNEEVTEVLDDGVFYGLDLGVNYDEMKTGIKLTYNRLTVGETEEITRIETTLQPNIMTELLNISLPSPLYMIEQVKTGVPCALDSIKSSQNNLSLYLTSSISEEATAEVVVLGKFIKFVESFLERKEQVENQDILDVCTQLIQDTSSAQILLSLLYPRLTQRTLTGYIMPDDFDIKLCKIYKVSSNVKGLNPIYAYVHGFKFSAVEGDVDLEIILQEIKEVEVNE